MNKQISCGIDFGTSNSAIATNLNGNINLATVEKDKSTIPSAMFYPRKQPQELYGRLAIQLFLEGTEGRFMRSLKRVLGTPIMKQGTMINGRVIKFNKIIGGFVQNLKNKAESTVSMEIENVVMGRPVHFVDNNHAADTQAQTELEEIARSIGFKNIAFQYEPIAAAYAHERKLSSEKLALIADIGGGTSDFTVIKLSNEYLKKADRSDDILANEGIRIGGNDLDKKLSLAAFMPELGYKTTYGEKILTAPVKPFHDLSEWSKVNFLYTNKLRMQIRKILNISHDQKRFGRLLSILERETGHTLLQQIESAKIALTNQQHANAALSCCELFMKSSQQWPTWQ